LRHEKQLHFPRDEKSIQEKENYDLNNKNKKTQTITQIPKQLPPALPAAAGLGRLDTKSCPRRAVNSAASGTPKKSGDITHSII